MTVRFSTSPPEVRTRWSCAGDHRRRYEVICHFSGSRVLSKQTNHRRMTKQSPDLVTSLPTWFTIIFTWRHGQSWRHDPAEQQLMCNISGLISSSCHAVDHCCQDPDTTPPQVPDTDPTQDSDNPDTDPPQNPDTDPTQDPDTDPPQDHSWHLSPSSDPGDGRAPTERWLVWAVYTSAPLYTCSGHSALQHPAPRQRNRATSWLNDAKMMQ